MTTKALYLTPERRGIVHAFLEEKQARAGARTVGVEDIEAAARRADKLTPLAILTKAQKRGAVVIWRPVHRLPNSYKWRADATAVRLEYGAQGWRLVNAWRETANESESGEFTVRLPTDVAETARRRFDMTFIEA